MQNIHKIAVTTLAGLLFNGWVVAAPKDVLNCKRYDAEVVNLSTLPDADKKVIMLEFDGGTSRAAENANASGVLRNMFDVLLSKTGVEVTDMSLIENQQIRDAITRYEMEGTSEFSTALATNAIGAKLTTVTLSASYNDGTQTNEKSGLLDFNSILSGNGVTGNPFGSDSAGYCSHTATVKGVFKVYGINPLKLSSSTEFKNTETVKIESSSGSCYLDDLESANLVSTAIEKAIKKQASRKIFEVFRSAGYIREIRMCGKTPYVWISTPPSSGATTKAKVKFFQQDKFIDPITRESINRKRYVGEGQIIETQNPDEAWVKLKNRKYVKNLRIGYLAEIEQAPPSALCTLLDVC
ncbi:MAG: hypothetical protein BMS9Abin32_499 [Gammaproteobacteria bacterium]|nr:MAG: hypothetical protein BMS9Abin32_499 [Gammaproteobacteria bacterium]